MRHGIAAAAMLAVVAAAQAGDARAAEPLPRGPWRVFILSGQSNMQGMAAAKHLEKLLADDATAGPYRHLRTGDAWTERSDVFIRFTDGAKRDQTGRLRVGYGSRGDRFGPEPAEAGLESPDLRARSRPMIGPSWPFG